MRDESLSLKPMAQTKAPTQLNSPLTNNKKHTAIMILTFKNIERKIDTHDTTQTQPYPFPTYWPMLISHNISQIY